MKLDGIDFGPIWGASGVQGFFGEGYWYHKYIPGLNFDGITFVAKTTTLEPRVGNMPLRQDFSPREWKPKCMAVKPLKGVVLNSVGLSGPGAKRLFEMGLWQARKDPFFLSFMAVAVTRSGRKEELREFVNLFARHLPHFRGPVGLQINFSCPNVGINPTELIEEVEEFLKIAATLRIPLVPKFNILLPPRAAASIAQNQYCDAICISNTIPWGAIPEEIDWFELFGTLTSPLSTFGGGGLSGKPLLPLVANWIEKTRRVGLKKPINAGGGILKPQDVVRLHTEGASSVFVGSVVMLRPWNLKSIIRTAHFLGWHQ